MNEAKVRKIIIDLIHRLGYPILASDHKEIDLALASLKELEPKVPSIEELEKELRANFDSFFHQVHFYIDVEGWYDDGIKKSAKNIHDAIISILK